MGKGKGRRRRQANYLAAHGGQAALPAPPSASDISAVPSKLRRIISLKVSSSLPSSDLSKSGSIANVKAKMLQREKGTTENQHKVKNAEEQDDSSIQRTDVGEGEELSHASLSEAPKKKKRKREDDLQVLMEKYKAAPMRKGLNDRKKRYLQEKKKKKKKLVHFDSLETNHSLHEREKIGFGDIVDAPPKLLFPKKHMNVAEERLRQQAVETYRQKKRWLSRPGSHQPPPLANLTVPNL